MKTFYQIVTKQDIDESWVGYFVENSEIYTSYEDAYKSALNLALKHTQGFFNNHLEIRHDIEDDCEIIQIFNPQINDVEKEYYIQKLTVA